MHSALSHIEHRPWPIPARRWVWRQSWRDLLFAHWPISAEALRPFVPESLVIQEFDGTSWIALVPFRMSGVMLRPFPDIPGISAFAELNVRIYVEHGGKSGVWFLSLDANNSLAVWAARRFFHLPYYRAEMSIEPDAAGFRYSSTRPDAGLTLTYRATSPVHEAIPGTLEHWLTERYCLYARAPDGSVWRNDVHHRLWPLQRAEAEFAQNTMFNFHGLDVPGPPALLHFSRQIDAIVWNAERVA